MLFRSPDEKVSPSIEGEDRDSERDQRQSVDENFAIGDGSLLDGDGPCVHQKFLFSLPECEGVSRDAQCLCAISAPLWLTVLNEFHHRDTEFR